jgi:Tol biopolymer transport system component
VNETQLWTADVDGTNPTKLPIECSSPCALVDNAAWSPDGRTILFSRLESSPNDVPVSQVQSIDLATGTVTTLFTTAPLQGVDYPRWSPDGKSIVFTINRFDSLEAPGPNGTAIATLDITTPSSEPVILTDWSAFGTYPDWSPDGTSIVFSTYDLERRFTIPDPSQPSDLYTMNPDGTALTEITHNPSGTALIRLNSASGPLSTQPTWSPDSKSIIFTQVDGPEWPGWTLATIGADGTNQASATESIPMTGTHPRLRPIP